MLVFQGFPVEILRKYAGTTRSIKQMNTFTVLQPYSWASLAGVFFVKLSGMKVNAFYET